MWTFRHPYKKLLSTKDRINLHAHAELFRGMHNERMVAFVGSGVSLPYGRLNWSELTRLLVMEVDAFYRSSEIQSQEARVLHDALLKATDTHDDQAPIFLPLETGFDADINILELCADLCRELQSPNFLKETTARHIGSGPIGQFGARLILLDGIGANTLHSHWLKILDKTIRKVINNQTEGNSSDRTRLAHFLKKRIDATTHHTKIKTIAKKKVIKRYHKELKKIWKKKDKTRFTRKEIEKKPWKILKKSLDSVKNKDVFKNPEQDPNQIGDIDSYAAVHAALAIIAHRLFDAQTEGSKIYQYRETKKKGHWPDPIRAIADTLKIRRFITLNYDLEIEEFFKSNREFGEQNQAVPKQLTHLSNIQDRLTESYDGFRSRMTSVTLNDSMIGCMIDFSTLDEDDSYYVFHLHGRVDKPDDLVLTEKDYQSRYLRDDAARAAFDEGINTLFSGNDVLFLGVGMNEADLLQPLRQFTAQGDRANRERDGIIALLNAENEKRDNSIQEDTKYNERQTIKLYTQYGVKTIYYSNLHKNKNKNISLDSKKENIKNEIGRKKNRQPANSRKLIALRLGLLRIARKECRRHAWELNKKLKKLANQQKKWRLDWNQSPQKRLAMFRNWSPYDGQYIWIRQRILARGEQTSGSSFRNHNPQFKALVKRPFWGCFYYRDINFPLPEKHLQTRSHLQINTAYSCRKFPRSNFMYSF